VLRKVQLDDRLVGTAAGQRHVRLVGRVPVEGPGSVLEVVDVDAGHLRGDPCAPRPASRELRHPDRCEIEVDVVVGIGHPEPPEVFGGGGRIVELLERCAELLIELLIDLLERVVGQVEMQRERGGLEQSLQFESAQVETQSVVVVESDDVAALGHRNQEDGLVTVEAAGCREYTLRAQQVRRDRGRVFPRG